MSVVWSLRTPYLDSGANDNRGRGAGDLDCFSYRRFSRERQIALGGASSAVGYVFVVVVAQPDRVMNIPIALFAVDERLSHCNPISLDTNAIFVIGLGYSASLTLSRPRNPPNAARQRCLWHTRRYRD